jgi:hypothetical protein
MKMNFIPDWYHLTFVGSCIFVQSVIKSTNKMQWFSEFISRHLFVDQHVSGVVGRGWAEYSERPQPTTLHPSTCNVCKTRGCVCRCMLLVLGGTTPKTCWATNKHRVINSENRCILLVDFIIDGTISLNTTSTCSLRPHT